MTVNNAFNAARKPAPELLIKAAIDGKIDAVTALLEQGADPDAPNKSGDVAIVAAARNHHTNIIHLLIDKGADVSKAGLIGNTTLHIAVIYDELDLANLL